MIFPVLLGFTFLFFLFFLIAGCGFQLNRNRIQLPNGAQSVYLYNFSNNSYTPRLEFDLKNKLIGKFALNSITIQPDNNADLVLSFVIDALSMTKSTYSLDDSDQTYDFAFKSVGKLTVYDNRTQTYYLKDTQLTGSYSIKTTDSDLSTIDEEEGRSKALDSLASAISEKLTDSF